MVPDDQPPPRFRVGDRVRCHHLTGPTRSGAVIWIGDRFLLDGGGWSPRPFFIKLDGTAECREVYAEEDELTAIAE